MVLKSVFINVDFPIPVSPANGRKQRGRRRKRECVSVTWEYFISFQTSIFIAVTEVNLREGQRDSGEMYSSYTFSVRYSPTHRMLKQKPCVTDLLTSCSGRLSNPTWPPKLRLRFSSFYGTQKKKKSIRSLADVRKTHGRVIIQNRMAQILKRSHSNARKHQRPSAQSAHVKSITPHIMS